MKRLSVLIVAVVAVSLAASSCTLTLARAGSACPKAQTWAHDGTYLLKCVPTPTGTYWSRRASVASVKAVLGQLLAARRSTTTVPATNAPTTVAQRTVPSLAGLQPSAVTAALSAAGLTLGSSSMVLAPIVAGAVVSQTPAAGATVSAGSTVNVTVSDGHGASAVAAGEYFSCAIVVGVVKCWGSNLDGVLGDGSTTDSTSPVTVVGSPTRSPWVSLTTMSAPCAQRVQ